MRTTRLLRGSDGVWAIASAAATLAAALWLASPRVGYLAVCFAATAVAILVALRNIARSRRWPVAAGLVLLVFLAMALAAQRTIWRVDDAWEAYSGDVTARGAIAIRSQLIAAAV